MATVTLTPVTPRGTGLVLELADDAYRTGGDSQWEEVPRPRREAGLEYTGTSARGLVLPGMFDGIGKAAGAPNTRTATRGLLAGVAQAAVNAAAAASASLLDVDLSVEPQCARLEAMARRTATTGQPPILSVSGSAAHGSIRWVIDSLEWDEHPILTVRSARCQQLVTVTLKEFQPVEALFTEPRSGSGKAKVHSTRVLRSDFPGGLKRVAARTLGKSSRWTEIAALNKNRQGRVIRDPADIYVGQELRYP